MTELQYKQEIMAEYVDDKYQPIPTALIEKAINNDLKFLDAPEEKHLYVAGLDLGRKRDRSVLWILKVEQKGHVQLVYNKISMYNPDDPRFWSKVIDHTEYVCKDFKVNKLIVDCTGLGDKVVIDMKNQFNEHQSTTRVEGFNFTYASKNKWEGLINQLALKFERYLIHFPFHMELIKQLKSIRFNSQKALYEAIGNSPDQVMALALAVKAAPDFSTSFHTKANAPVPEMRVSHRIETQRKIAVSYP